MMQGHRVILDPIGIAHHITILIQIATTQMVDYFAHDVMKTEMQIACDIKNDSAHAPNGFVERYEVYGATYGLGVVKTTQEQSSVFAITPKPALMIDLIDTKVLFVWIKTLSNRMSYEHMDVCGDASTNI